MAAKLRNATGKYLQVVPSILPLYEPELVAGFCRHGFATLPPEVKEITDAIFNAENTAQREWAIGRADKYIGDLSQEFAANFSELAFYPGKKNTSAKQLAEVIKILCERGILQPDLPATAVWPHWCGARWTRVDVCALDVAPSPRAPLLAAQVPHRRHCWRQRGFDPWSQPQTDPAYRHRGERR